MKGEEWALARIPVIDFGVLARRGREMLGKWEGWLGEGVLPTHNRLERATLHLEAFNRDFPKGEGFSREHSDRGALIADAVKTLTDAFIVAYAVTDRKQGQRCITKKHLRAFLEGLDEDVPTGDSRPRSIQFEAISIAQFVLAGATVRLAEPDFCVEYHGEMIGMAVKRLGTRNPKSVNKRLRAGARQLRDNRLRGFVILSVDPWIDDADHDDPNILGELFDRDMREAYEQLGAVSQKKHVMGVIAWGSKTYWKFDKEQPRFVSKSPQKFQGFIDNDRERHDFNSYFGGLLDRWVNAMAEIGEFLAGHRKRS